MAGRCGGRVTMLESLRGSLAPQYEVAREIGAGGAAKVFLAIEQPLGRRVAIKVLSPVARNTRLKDRFIREVQLCSTLSHPHIVPIFAAGDVAGYSYYVMPYLE